MVIRELQRAGGRVDEILRFTEGLILRNIHTVILEKFFTFQINLCN